MVLITGGTGLVGRHLLEKLLAAGERVRALHRPASDRMQVEDYLKKRRSMLLLWSGLKQSCGMEIG